MIRMGQCIGVKPEQIALYKKLHAEVWPEILDALTRANIRNYSIFLREPENLLFAYWEYVGDNYAHDMVVLANAPRMQEWWDICDPLQNPLQSRQEGEWWAQMEPVFYHP